MLGKIIIFILERMPNLEIAIRRFLWHFPQIKELIKEKDKKQSKSVEVDPVLWNKVQKQLREYDIQKGDILLVHSSMDGLYTLGVTPKDIIDFLLELVGEDGTLVFAAYPKCRKYQGMQDVLYYDPKKTISWTGLLPNVFCKYKGVVRSSFPYNSLAAKGRHAEKMMEHNLEGDTSQGKGSAWEYCVNHHAKILYLGVSAALSCTMMNYPEDALGEEWPIKNWYYTQKYAIKVDDEIQIKTIYERYPEWYRFYAMFHSEYWMLKNQFLVRNYVGDVYTGFTPDMYTLAEELLRLGRLGYSVYRIPKKYWKEK